MHICYVYIYKYRVLQDVALSFDAHYRFHFDKETRVLRIEPGEALPKMFWGKGVYALSGLIGDNGSGKSTVMSFLLDALVSGSGKKEANGIIVYENAGQLYVYNNDKFGEIACEGMQATTSELCKINTFYYSGHFFPYTSGDDLRCFEVDGSCIASEGCRLISDAEGYLNVGALHLTQPMWYYLNSYVVQNNYRICSLLADTDLVKSFNEFKLPRKVLVSVNKSGVQAFTVENINKDEKEKYQLPPEKTMTWAGKGIIEEWLIYHNMVNAMRDINRRPRIRKLLENWLDVVNGDSDIIIQFEEFVKNNEEHDDEMVLSDILASLKALVSLAHYNEDLRAFYFDIFDDKDDFSKFVNGVLKTKRFVVNRFADLAFCHSLDDDGPTTLSSGEQQMLNLFSRIYAAADGRAERASNRYATPLLLLDEAETGFHPEWQRRYIQLLVSFLSKLMVQPGFDFQIIITSHSPILLSDIPASCTNRLKIVDGKPVVYNNSNTNTYASNVFDLYRDYLPTEDGLIGEFASNRLRLILSRLEDNKLDEDTAVELKKEIEMIGDTRIRNYMMRRMSNHNKRLALDYYQRQIDRIRGNEQD